MSGQWIKIVMSLALLALPLACDEENIDFNPEGVWAWHDAKACASDGSHLIIQGDKLRAELRGQVILEGEVLTWRAGQQTAGQLLILTYDVAGRRYEDTYRILERDRLEFRRSLIDGVENQAMSEVGKAVLLRCSDNAMK